ncbi:MAG TPA: condensation domain-containing protein, partial [Blastocatellia bacterium]|nr:condensation domain-containing protein [Blastocatellia bacterium]
SDYETILQKIASDPALPLSALVESLSDSPGLASAHLRQTEDLYEQSNLTAMQLLFWIGQKVQPGVPVYNRPGRFTIEGPVDPFHFRKAFRALVESADALRMVIRETDGVPRKLFLPAIAYDLEYFDFSTLPDPERTLDEWVHQRSRVNFDLETRMFESALLKLSDRRYVYFMNYHNIIADGLSGFLMYAAIREAYARSMNGEPVLLNLPPSHDYDEFERQHRASRRYLKSDLYWKQKLARPSSPLTLHGRKAPAARRGATRVTHFLEPAITERLRELVNRKGIFAGTGDLSLFSVFATVLMAYLYQVSGSREISIAVTYHNRVSKSFARTIGVLMQVLPLRITLEEGETFQSLSRRISGEILDGLKHLPYSVRDSGEYRGGQVLLNYINSSWPTFDNSPVNFLWDHSGHQDELLIVQPHRSDVEGNLAIEFDFDNLLFDQEQRGQAIGEFCQVMNAFIADVDTPADAPDLLWNDAQRQRKSALESQARFDFDL